MRYIDSDLLYVHNRLPTYLPSRGVHKYQPRLHRRIDSNAVLVAVEYHNVQSVSQLNIYRLREINIRAGFPDQAVQGNR